MELELSRAGMSVANCVLDSIGNMATVGDGRMATRQNGDTGGTEHGNSGGTKNGTTHGTKAEEMDGRDRMVEDGGGFICTLPRLGWGEGGGAERGLPEVYA